jgi:hypothetical protein
MSPYVVCYMFGFAGLTASPVWLGFDPIGMAAGVPLA